MDHRTRYFCIPFFLAFSLSSCRVPSPGQAQRSTPTIECNRDGNIGGDTVPNPTQGYPIQFQYYLPPCFENLTTQTFPTIYLVNVSTEWELSSPGKPHLSLPNQLIRSGKMPPAIIVVPDPAIGVGYYAALAKDLIPYVDVKFRSIRQRQYRGVGGISFGAAIAARMAFEFSDTFGSVGVFSGGIAAGEKDTVEAWITHTPKKYYPRVLLDVGDQDAIIDLSNNLMEILDREKVPYILNIGHGSHSMDYWASRMESYLLWFAEAWK